VLRNSTVDLDSRETTTLFRIASGGNEAESIAEGDVNRLQSLGLVEQRGMSIGLTTVGIQTLARLRRG
jgi:hypothetical protein